MIYGDISLQQFAHSFRVAVVAGGNEGVAAITVGVLQVCLSRREDQAQNFEAALSCGV